MAFSRFQRRDAQRLKKVYPAIRKTPRYIIQSDGELNIETHRQELSGVETYRYVFDQPYVAVPRVTTSVENDGVLCYITSISTSEVNFAFSAPFDGILHIQVIYIGEE